MTTTQTPSYRLRFTCHGSPHSPDQVREQTIPVHLDDGRYSSLVTEAFDISGAEPGAVITQVQGTYVRTWTLLEVIK